MAMIPLIFLVVILGAGIILSVRFLLGGPEDSWICQRGEWVKHGNPQGTKPTAPCTGNSVPVTQAVTLTAVNISPTNKASDVPLPSGEDIIRTFFELINEKRIPAAIDMMSRTEIEDDSQKQAWGVEFNAFESIKTKSVVAYNKESWTDKEQEYKVNLTVQMKPEAAKSGPIPNYGFDNGDNVRWIMLVKENNLWKVKGIGTGP